MKNRHAAFVLTMLVVIGASAACENKPQAAAATPEQHQSGQWVDPANKSDELVNGPYQVGPN